MSGPPVNGLLSQALTERRDTSGIRDPFLSTSPADFSSFTKKLFTVYYYILRLPVINSLDNVHVKGVKMLIVFLGMGL